MLLSPQILSIQGVIMDPYFEFYMVQFHVQFLNILDKLEKNSYFKMYYVYLILYNFLKRGPFIE